MTGSGNDRDAYEDEAPPSIFSRLWFRAVLVVLFFGVVAIVAIPYVNDMLNAPGRSTVATRPPSTTASPSPSTPPVVTTTPPTSPGPSTPPTSAKMDSTPPDASTNVVTAAPPTSSIIVPATPPAPARSEPTTTAKAIEKPRTKVAAAKTPSPASTKVAAASGPYWVQVGAFKDQATATRLADQLRGQNYQVKAFGGTPASGGMSEPSSAPTTDSPSDRYDVFVSGGEPAEIMRRLTAKGVASELVAGGVLVTPSLPLRDAVALSKDLASDGLKVQVRRRGSSGGSTAASGDGLYRVRVGSYTDRAAAQAAAKELEAKGYKPFVGRGGS